jgi:hypothetical protein
MKKVVWRVLRTDDCIGRASFVGNKWKRLNRLKVGIATNVPDCFAQDSQSRYFYRENP